MWHSWHWCMGHCTITHTHTQRRQAFDLKQSNWLRLITHFSEPPIAICAAWYAFFPIDFGSHVRRNGSNMKSGGEWWCPFIDLIRYIWRSLHYIDYSTDSVCHSPFKWNVTDCQVASCAPIDGLIDNNLLLPFGEDRGERKPKTEGVAASVAVLLTAMRTL